MAGGRAQFAGCLVQPLLGEAIQLVSRPHSVLVLRDGDILNLIAERHGTTESKLRSLNPLLRQFSPELSSCPSEEPLTAGTTLLLPVYRSTTPIPAGEWLYLPARRSAPVLDELPEQGF